MAFDFNLPLRDADDEIDEELLEDHTTELLRLFAESPDAREHVPAEAGIGWAVTMTDYGARQLRATPATMTVAELRKVLLDVFPRRLARKSRRENR